MAISVIGEAIRKGNLTLSQTVVEYTGGSTGSALAFACACLGIKFTAIFSDAFSYSKQLAMEAFGAEQYCKFRPTEKDFIHQNLLKK